MARRRLIRRPGNAHRMKGEYSDSDGCCAGDAAVVRLSEVSTGVLTQPGHHLCRLTGEKVLSMPGG